MARRVILDTQYTFTPSTRSVVIPRVILRERLLLITNVTTNTVIYNFSDSTLTATNYSIAQGTSTANATTTVVLNYNTTSMSSTDKLSIVIDEAAEVFVPDDAFQDPVGKFRVSQPQALIDTDFEYGLQPTKWETLNLLNNRPSFFVNTQNPITITNVTATQNSTSIVVATTTPPAIGTPILVQDTAFPGANGPFIVTAISAGVSFTYTARYAFTGATGTIYNLALTQAYSGTFYSGAAFTLSAQPTVVAQGAQTVVTVTTTEPHAVQIGNQIAITGASAGANPPNGVWWVASVPTVNSFQIIPDNNVTGPITGASVYPYPNGVYIHRAFDGGVQFSTASTSHNLQTIRQTRRYFRYQSGKGIQVSTGTILRPGINIDDMSASGTTITVITKAPHYLNVGASITISGADQTAYNGNFVVDTIIDAQRFTYIAASVPTSTPASGIVQLSIINWRSSKARVGIFDSQNGMFFEYDGQTLFAVRRKSTDQLSGAVNLTNGSATVTGASQYGATTKFSKQLVPGDYIVIRGMTYRVMNIASDTSMTISPPYRGNTLSGINTAIVTKTIEIKVPQNAWNIDKMDGTGPSGTNLDISKMQMYYIDYSWYGAGFIRFGFRDTTGRIIYCHRFVNNNQNTEAYMRSGNLPGRYETNTISNATILSATLLSSDTTMTVSNTDGFATAGTVFVDDSTGGNEYITYTGKTTTTFTGLTRGKANTTVTGFVLTPNVGNVTTTQSITGLYNGMYVYGSNTAIPSGTFIANIWPGPVTNTLTLSQAPYQGNAAATLSFLAPAGVAATHTYSATAPISVYQHSPAFSPTISHWGTSVIMDGGFDNDKSLVFVYGETVNTIIGVGAIVPLLSLRVSPTVDSGVPGTLGTKEIVNRMQLQLSSTAALVNGSFLLYLVLNGNITANTGSLGTFQRVAVGTSSLAQIADHTGNCVINGGENIFGYYAVNSAGAGNFSVQDAELTKLRDLGNSILGGGFNNTPNTNVYPDGPDVITVVAQNIGTTPAAIQARISWTEAQA